MTKYGLRFADTLSSCRPSAWISDDTELQWSNIEWPSYSYAKPLIDLAPHASLKTLALPITQPKDWEIRVDQLDEHCTLLPTRYRPLDGESRQPGFPPNYSMHSGSLPTRRRSGVLPGQKWTQISRWYAGRLQALRVLYRQRGINAKQHLAALRLLAAQKHQMERRFCTPFQSPNF
jgi:hypothetical protein